jgi:hypothetical protein
MSSTLILGLAFCGCRPCIRITKSILFMKPVNLQVLQLIVKSYNLHGIEKLMKFRYLSTYLFTPWSTVLLVKLNGFQLVKKFLPPYGTRSFLTAFTSAYHLSLSWASSIQSILPHPTSWRSILILSTYLHLALLSGLFPSGFPTKILYTPLSSPTALHALPFSILSPPQYWVMSSLQEEQWSFR